MGAVILASWSFGRFGPLVVPVVAGVCLLAWVFSLMAARSAAFEGWPAFVPWIVFLALGVVGLFNPAYERVILPDDPLLPRQVRPLLSNQ